MWVIIQAGAWKSEEILDEFQLDWQVYTCLAYGARAIILASYSKGWWDKTTSCVNPEGKKNKTYEYTQKIFSVLHSPLGTEFLKYKYMGTRVYGGIDSSDERIRPQLKKQNETEKQDFPGIKINSDKAVVVGYFEKENDHAVMIVNSHNPFDSSAAADVKIESSKKPVTEITIKSGQGMFMLLS